MEHTGTARLETERLILRRFTPNDAPAMYKNWASDPEVTRFLTWPCHPDANASRQLLTLWASEYENPANYNWAIELREIGEVIGSIAVVRQNESILAAELGYCMGRAWWGRGLMTEAASAVTRYLFEQEGFNRVAAEHDVDNPRSGRVMQKLGMRFEGVRRQGARNNRGIVDMACYAILADDYAAQKGRKVEIWDAYDREGRPLGFDLVRGEDIPDGAYFLACEVAVRHVNGKYLVMRRDPRKSIYPGRLEFTAGGSALKGEDALACVRRELMEETGLVCDDFRPLRLIVREQYRMQLYACTVDCDPDAIRLQPGETSDWRWVSREELLALMDSPEMVPSTKERFYRYVVAGEL